MFLTVIPCKTYATGCRLPLKLSILRHQRCGDGNCERRNTSYIFLSQYSIHDLQKQIQAVGLKTLVQSGERTGTHIIPSLCRWM